MAQAQNFLLSPAIYYSSYDLTRQNNTGEAEVTTTRYDLRFGYIMDMGLTLGAIYASDTEDYGSSDQVTTSYGVSVGYVADQFAILGHYFLSSEQDPGSDAFEGTGIQIDLTYLFEISGSVAFGPQLSYKSFTWDERADSGSLDQARKLTRIDPYFQFWFRF